MLQVTQRPSSAPIQRDEVTGEKPKLFKLHGCPLRLWVCKSLSAIGVGSDPSIAHQNWVSQCQMIIAKRWLRGGGC